MAQKLLIRSRGIDISKRAILAARSLSKSYDVDDKLINFDVLNDGQQLQAKDREFDVCLCDSVIDSMPFANAKASILELARVTIHP
jgi:ubiquinone/menaquinone biosynthesis C-methylase UbiE